MLIQSNDDLMVFCKEFRKGMIGRKSSKGQCAKISWALRGFLSQVCNMEALVYEGDVGRWNHMWLVTEGGDVIDCAAGQFGKEYPKIHIGEPLDIHQNGKPFDYREHLGN